MGVVWSNLINIEDPITQDTFSALKQIFSFFFFSLLCHCVSFFVYPTLPVFFFRWPFKGYSPAHRRWPLLRLHQRQLHRCKWKRIECYYWLPTKPTKPHSLARMSGLYTFIASTSHPSCHFYASSHPENTSYIQYMCLPQVSVLFCLYPCIHVCIHSELVSWYSQFKLQLSLCEILNSINYCIQQ